MGLQSVVIFSGLTKKGNFSVEIKFSWFQIGLSVIQTVIFILQTAFPRTDVLPPNISLL